MKYVIVFLLGSIKMALAIPSALALGLNGWEMGICLASGGVLGSFVFSYSGVYVWGRIQHLMLKTGRKSSKINRKKRWLVQLKNGAGLWVISALAPGIFSIPLGCFVGLKMSRYPWKVALFMSISSIIWGLSAGFLMG